MSIPRPKILSVVTVPTGGWDFKFYASIAGAYDTAITATIPAGDYFMAGDNQSDDFLFALQTQMQAGVTSALGANAYVMVDIHPTSHKVRIKFDGADFADAGAGDNDVKLAWTESDVDMYEVLGFNGAADDTSTAVDYPLFTADWHHAYGWYSDEDGQLESLSIADGNSADVSQGRSLGGQVKTQYRGEYFESILRLSQIERNFNGRTKMISKGVSYAVAPVHPYNRNEPLECWWREACQGKRFRVYRDGYVNTDRASDRGAQTGQNTTTVTDTGKSWAIEPYRWKSMVLHCAEFEINGAQITQSYFVASHTATVLTVANAHPSGLNILDAASTYYLFEHEYGTYVVDLGDMSKWDPDDWEIPGIDRYSVEIPLMRHVA